MHAILHQLAHQIRVLTVRQAAHLHGTDAIRLLKTGHLEAVRLPCYSLTVTSHLAIWRPGVMLDLGAIAYRARTRFEAADLVLTSCVVLSQKMRKLLGATTRWPRLSEAPHDLVLAQVFCLPDTDRKAWKGERSTKQGVMVPDATIRRTAIEVVGSSYTRQKLESLVEFCSEKFAELRLC